MSINLEELEQRGIYRLKARNLTMGVWTGRDWIGIRDKFGLRLDRCEVPGDDTHRGTAYAIEKIGELPKRIELRDAEKTECSNCKQPVEFVPDSADRPIPGRWVHTNYNNDCDSARPMSRQYQPLFDYLTDIGGVPDDVRNAGRQSLQHAVEESQH